MPISRHPASVETGSEELGILSGGGAYSRAAELQIEPIDCLPGLLLLRLKDTES